MSVLNQVIFGLLLMVTLIIIGSMVRVYSRTVSRGREEIEKQARFVKSEGEEMTQNE